METTRIVFKNGDTKEVVSFVPQDTRDLCIVDVSTLKRITGKLTKVHITVIREALIVSINNCTNLDEICSVMEEELNFHKTVNLIEKYNPEKS